MWEAGRPAPARSRGAGRWCPAETRGTVRYLTVTETVAALLAGLLSPFVEANEPVVA